MQNTGREKTACIFCGQTLVVTTTYDDGRDWNGHQRGKSSSETNTEKCTCKLGKLLGTISDLKPMCANCRYYGSRSCSNKKQLEEVKKVIENFEIEQTSLIIKNKLSKCKYHEFNYSIFECLIQKKGN